MTGPRRDDTVDALSARTGNKVSCLDRNAPDARLERDLRRLNQRRFADSHSRLVRLLA